MKCVGRLDSPMAPQGRDTEYTLSRVTEVFESRDDYAEPLTASEVAEALECSRRTALNKLHELEADTDVTSKKVGGRSRVWWIPIEV
jgi:predicted ArsR family transcriptional regulator